MKWWWKKMALYPLKTWSEVLQFFPNFGFKNMINYLPHWKQNYLMSGISLGNSASLAVASVVNTLYYQLALVNNDTVGMSNQLIRCVTRYTADTLPLIWHADNFATIWNPSSPNLGTIPSAQQTTKGFCLDLWRRIWLTTMGHFLIRTRYKALENVKYSLAI